MNLVYGKLDVTNELSSYFESKEDINEFHSKVLAYYENLEKQNYKNIYFNIDTHNYVEFEDSYSNIIFEFIYQREINSQELLELELKEKRDLEDKEIIKQLTGKLSNNSIGSIIHNNDLRDLYLSGKITI